MRIAARIALTLLIAPIAIGLMLAACFLIPAGYALALAWDFTARIIPKQWTPSTP